MISTLSWTRSAIVLTWVASSMSSMEPHWAGSSGTRRARSPSANPRLASVRRRIGTVIRRAIAAPAEIETASASRPMMASRPVVVASAVARYV